MALPHVGENEDVATNGKLALVSQLGNEGYVAGHKGVVSQLHVIDVEDPYKPKRLASVRGAGSHTTECLFDCTWAYGSLGQIVDLRDPRNPRFSDVDWRERARRQEEFESAHDVFEVRPGRVLTGSMPRDLLLDVRDPEDPKVLARSAEDDEPSYHQVNWPNRGRDRFILGGNEGLPPSL